MNMDVNMDTKSVDSAARTALQAQKAMRVVAYKDLVRHCKRRLRCLPCRVQALCA